MKHKFFSYEDLTTGPYICLWRFQLFIYRRCWWSDWKSFSFNADGVFAISTPWFLFYPW